MYYKKYRDASCTNKEWRIIKIDEGEIEKTKKNTKMQVDKRSKVNPFQVVFCDGISTI